MKAQVAMQVLGMMILVVVTSALILLLLNTGVIAVSGQVDDASVLNAEFLPIGRLGFLAIVSVDFCGFIDETFTCFEQGNVFDAGDDVYVRLLVETSTYGNDIRLTRNYQIKNPRGEIIFLLDDNNKAHFDLESRNPREVITFADFFTTGNDYIAGEYTLDVVVENPLLGKEVRTSSRFVIE